MCEYFCCEVEVGWVIDCIVVCFYFIEYDCVVGWIDDDCYVVVVFCG